MQSKLVILLTVLIWAHLNSLAQDKWNANSQHKQLYESAFLEITQMLQGAKPVSFKRAVFLTENAFLNGNWTYERFNGQITAISIKLKQLIKERHLERFKTASNWAVFTYMTDSVALNNFKPYKYDFDNFLPDKDPTVGFVTKLLSTNKGNCNSLPFLYKILTEEIGGTAYLALAPIHCYIKHKDEKGMWVNLEMTSGSFARDEWIMQQSGVTVEQIKSGIYMNALTQKESLALILKELAANYQFQFGVGDFDLKVVETALKYYPTGVNLYMVKFEHNRQNLLTARKLNDKILEEKYYKMLQKLDQQLIELAYKEPSKGDYEEWVKENEKGKVTSTNSKSTSK